MKQVQFGIEQTFTSEEEAERKVNLQRLVDRYLVNRGGMTNDSRDLLPPQ